MRVIFGERHDILFVSKGARHGDARDRAELRREIFGLLGLEW
jgi:hypothetical protein